MTNYDDDSSIDLLTYNFEWKTHVMVLMIWKKTIIIDVVKQTKKTWNISTTIKSMIKNISKKKYNQIKTIWSEREIKQYKLEDNIKRVNELVSNVDVIRIFLQCE